MTQLHNRKSGLVTIVIATYNYGKYIIDALNGIKRQTYPDIEVIVVDDSSEDDTELLVKKWCEENEDIFINFIYLKLPRNCGAGWAYNIGFQISSGEYIVIHDADDISHSRKIDRQVRLLEEHPDTSAVGTGYRTFKNSIFQSKSGSHWLSFNPDSIERNYKAYLRHCVAYGTLMLRASMLEEIIGCFKAIPVGNDMFFVNNIVNHDFIVENIKQDLFFVRQHEGQMSSQIRHNKDDISVLKKRRVIEGLVSIVLPVKNSEATIYDTLESIGEQSYPNIELIVVDDASNDNTEEIVKDWYREYKGRTENSSLGEMVYFKLPKEAGYPWNYNIGSYLSRGEFIAFHHDKGKSDKNRIEAQVDFLNKNFMLSAVGTNYAPEEGFIRYDEDLERSYISEYMHCVNIHTLMVRYDVIHKTAGLNKSIQGAEDFEFIYRLLNNGYRVQNLRDILYFEERS
jgi:glycosyltransferase involved in cell wall biosynthesis